jgi:hypothetical protein
MLLWLFQYGEAKRQQQQCVSKQYVPYKRKAHISEPFLLLEYTDILIVITIEANELQI